MKLLLFLAVASLSAQVATNANSGYRTEQDRARVAELLTAPDRDTRQKPQELVAALGLRPGDTVADVGTGVGYLLPYLSRAVGPQGKVIAQDVFADFLAQAKANAAKHKLTNVEFVLGTERDAQLPAGAADVILVLDTYHHFDYPGQMLASLKRALKPGGRLVIVDFHKNQESMPNGRALEHIRLSAADAVREIESHGFRLASQRDFIPNVQWMAVFTAL